MKFGQQLTRHQIQRWSAFYVDYKGLKKSLSQLVTRHPEALSIDGRPRMCHQTWLRQVQENIDRVNTFFESTASDLEEHLSAAEEEMEESTQAADMHLAHIENLVRSLQSTLSDLSNYGAANYTALYKIFKKFDKKAGTQVLPRALEQLQQQPFHGEGKVRLENMQERLNSLARDLRIDTGAVADGAMTTAKLWHVARLSFSLGLISMALLVLAVLSGVEPQNSDYSSDALSALVPVFRLCFMVNLAVCLGGACKCVFEHYGINYLFLLDVSPDHEIPCIALLNFASFQTGVWIILFFACLADVKFDALMNNSSRTSEQVAHFWIVALLGAQVAPYIMSAGTTWRFLSVLGRVCFLHISSVSFVENLSADFLTSCSKPLKDAAYTWCYMRQWNTLSLVELRTVCASPEGFAAGGLQFLLAFPLLIRLSQCARRIYFTGTWMPHILNLGKYSAAILVSIVAALDLEAWFGEPQATIVRVSCYMIATAYAGTWDLTVDFGLTQENRRRLYPERVYPVIACLNVALRSTWSLTYLPDCKAFVKESAINSECFTFVISALELCRRGLWVILRLEHEHLSNASRFRSVCWVPPLIQSKPVASRPEAVDRLFRPAPSASKPLQRLIKSVKVVSLLQAGWTQNRLSKDSPEDGTLKAPPASEPALGSPTAAGDGLPRRRALVRSGTLVETRSADSALQASQQPKEEMSQEDSILPQALPTTLDAEHGVKKGSFERALGAHLEGPFARSISPVESDKLKSDLLLYTGLLPDRRVRTFTRDPDRPSLYKMMTHSVTLGESPASTRSRRNT
mmetsp:Transcript_58901/g.137639  ORF Transcript_58901/g.137639 Transcript_58901/m.137639 type:complete len:801 (-) Transcript_58901:101-2503(-)